MHRSLSVALGIALLSAPTLSSSPPRAEPLRLGADLSAGLGSVVYTGASLRVEVASGTPRGYLMRAGYLRGFEPVKEGDDLEGVTLTFGHRAYAGRLYAGFEAGLIALRRSPRDLAEPEPGDDGDVSPLLLLGAGGKLGPADLGLILSLPTFTLGVSLGFELAL